jgi:hypothetical protein
MMIGFLAEGRGFDRCQRNLLPFNLQIGVLEMRAHRLNVTADIELRRLVPIRIR